MLGYFRRAWWERYRLRELALEALPEEREPVAGLAFVEEHCCPSERLLVRSLTC
jgi:hypothetical protein